MSELENVKITMKQAVGPDSSVWYDVHNLEIQRLELESSPFSKDIIDQMANLVVKGWEDVSPIKFIEEFGDFLYDNPILEVYKLIMEQAKAAKELPNLSEEMNEMLSSVKISRDDKTEGVYSGEVILETDVSLLTILLESFIKNERKLPHLYATKLYENYLVKGFEDGSFVKMNREQLIYLRTFLDVWGVDAALSTLEEPEKVTIKFIKTNTSDTVYKNFFHLKTIK